MLPRNAQRLLHDRQAGRARARFSLVAPLAAHAATDMRTTDTAHLGGISMTAAPIYTKEDAEELCRLAIDGYKRSQKFAARTGATPRTDTEAIDASFPLLEVVAADFARQLERELRHANAEWGDAMKRLGTALSATLTPTQMWERFMDHLAQVEPIGPKETPNVRHGNFLGDAEKYRKIFLAAMDGGAKKP